MGHKSLSDKLDQIQKADLGIHFDESLLWEDLSLKLSDKKPVVFERRLLIAACITLLILLFPIVLINDSIVVETNGIAQSFEGMDTTELLDKEVLMTQKNDTEKVVMNKMRLYSVKGKKIDISIATIDLIRINIEPLYIIKEQKTERQLFADQDISIIQASLGSSSIEKGKSFTVRAQLHASSQPAQLNNQELKIKLFETSKE